MTNTPRLSAVQMLVRVEREGAYANLLLQKNLGYLTDSRDRQLATLLVNGVLKHRLTLDFALRQHLSKPLSSLPHEVRGILRVSALQILYMDRIPQGVAVFEGVEIAKRLQPKFTGLINGVLRSVVDKGWELPWPDAQKEPIRYLSIRYSHPEWLVRRWLKRWGLKETEEICGFNNLPAPTWIRTNTLKVSREELQARLASEGVKAEEGNRVPGSLTIEGFGAVESLTSFQEGLFTVQDESSQLVAHILNPQAGQKVLDACSAPGGKTTHLAERMGDEGNISAFDIYQHKVDLIKQTTQRLGIQIIDARLGDARELPGVEDYSQDRVLVDAPCSGLGILRRKADMRWQKEEKELAAFPPLQLEILNRASRSVAVGGELVYSTCTVEPEENFEVVKAFREAHPEFDAVNIAKNLPFELLDERDLKQAQKGMLQLLPHRHDMDGFFLAKFRRREV